MRCNAWFKGGNKKPPPIWAEVNFSTGFSRRKSDCWKGIGWGSNSHCSYKSIESDAVKKCERISWDFFERRQKNTGIRVFPYFRKHPYLSQSMQIRAVIGVRLIPDYGSEITR